MAGIARMRTVVLEVLECLSVRAPRRQAIPDDDAWLVTALADVFET